MRPSSAGSLATLAAGASLALAGCGGSGAATTTSTTPSSSSTVATTVVTKTATATSTVAGPSPSSSTTAAPARPSPCRAQGLALSFLGQQGAAGHGELGFTLRNTGLSSCATVGYPGIQFLGADGRALPTSPEHSTQDLFGRAPRRALVVGPGQSFSFRLEVSHGIAGSSLGCTTAEALGVIAPNDSTTIRVAIPGGAAECGRAIVSPVQPGARAYP